MGRVLWQKGLSVLVVVGLLSPNALTLLLLQIQMGSNINNAKDKIAGPWLRVINRKQD